jgi:hypothetical protein
MRREFWPSARTLLPEGDAYVYWVLDKGVLVWRRHTEIRALERRARRPEPLTRARPAHKGGALRKPARAAARAAADGLEDLFAIVIQRAEEYPTL